MYGYTCSEDDDESGYSSEQDYFSEASEEYDEEVFVSETWRLSLSSGRQSGCNHREYCPRDCTRYHDYRSQGRAHYHYIPDTLQLYRSPYGRYVRETGTWNLIRLDSDDDEEQQEGDEEKFGHHHSVNCFRDCAHYHCPEEPSLKRYRRSRDNTFHPDQGGRWMEHECEKGCIYIRLGPNDEDDYDYEWEPLARRSVTAPVLMRPLRKADPIAEEKKKKRAREEEKQSTPLPNAPKLALLFQNASPDAIFDNLKYHVMYENIALMEIVKQLGTLDRKPVAKTPNIVRILASGIPGTGKTTCMHRVAHLFEMQRGGRNQACFIVFELGGCKDASHCNRMTGPGHGYTGFGSPCLVNQLQEALDHIRTRPALENEPKVIALLLEEADKTINDIFDSLNSLLDRGELAMTDRSTRFILPDDVYLLVFITANYGASELDAMPQPNPNLTVAREIISRAMSANGVSDSNIRRMGIPVPFFGLARREAIETILSHLRHQEESQCVEERHHYLSLLDQCGRLSEEDLRHFVEYCVDGIYVREQGISRPIEFITKELNSNTYIQNSYLSSLVRNHECSVKALLSGKEPPVLSFHRIEYEEGMSLEALVKQYPMIGKALYSQFNRITLDMCLESGLPIAYFCLTLPHLELSNISILSPLGRPPVAIPSPPRVSPTISPQRKKPRLCDSDSF